MVSLLATIGRREFEQRLAEAEDGLEVVSTGLPEPVDAALDRVRHSAPNPPPRSLHAAREVFADWDQTSDPFWWV